MILCYWKVRTDVPEVGGVVERKGESGINCYCFVYHTWNLWMWILSGPVFTKFLSLKLQILTL